VVIPVCAFGSEPHPHVRAKEETLNGRRTLRFAGALSVVVISAALWSASGQPAPPTENSKSITMKLLGAVDLGPEIDGMAGRQLRMRAVTIPPGAVFAVHSHKDRPGIAYILQGTITEHRGDVAKDYGPGETWTEDRNTMHWLENRGTTPVVLLPVDVFKQPQPQPQP
jgi:quercetin dioxygenase-like cupin family protein